MIRRELANPRFKNYNIYNIDETGVLLSILNGLKYLVSALEARNYRGATVKRTLITVIKCISADGFALLPIIVWPALTYRTTWTTHPTPGWHFALQESGYADTAISLEWFKRVFYPQTVARANSEARLLISDGFGTHESAEIQRFAYENNIILARLRSHTSHLY